MSVLQQRIERAEAHLERLRARQRAAPCSEVGHRWKFVGGKNAGCGDGCGCSVPVHECTVCLACDYGDTSEAEQIRADCADAEPER